MSATASRSPARPSRRSWRPSITSSYCSTISIVTKPSGTTIATLSRNSNARSATATPKRHQLSAPPHPSRLGARLQTARPNDLLPTHSPRNGGLPASAGPHVRPRRYQQRRDSNRDQFRRRSRQQRRGQLLVGWVFHYRAHSFRQDAALHPDRHDRRDRSHRP